MPIQHAHGPFVTHIACVTYSQVKLQEPATVQFRDLDGTSRLAIYQV